MYLIDILQSKTDSTSFNISKKSYYIYNEGLPMLMSGSFLFSFFVILIIEFNFLFPLNFNN